MKSLFLILAIALCSATSLFAQTPATWRTSADSANVRLLVKDTTTALAIAKRIVTAVPDSADAWYSRAVMFYQARRWEEAVEDCGKALALKEQLEYYLLRSEAQQALKQPHAAIKTLSSAIAANPKNELPYYYRGLVTMRLGDMENAIYDFTDAIMLEAHFPEAYMKRGMAHIAAHHQADAIQDFDSCIALDPSRAEAYFLRGSIKIDQGKKQEAAKDLIKAAQLGYRTSTDLLRGYLADVVPKSTIDSLQTYTMQEVSVEADRDIVTTAKQDIRGMSRRAPSIIRAMIGRLGTGGLQRGRASIGGGGTIVTARDLLAPTTAAGLENKMTSQITLNEIVSFLRDRVAILGNEKARKILNEIMNMQQSVAMSSQTNTSDNATFIREQLYTISARIQELEKVLDEPAK